MLFFIYRLLTRAGKRDEVTLDMITTFEEARTDALSRGRWNYLTFAIREILGLLGSPGRLIPKTKWTLIPVGGLAGLALGVAASHLWPPSYTTEGVLLVHIGQIDQDPISSGGFDIDRTLSEAKKYGAVFEPYSAFLGGVRPLPAPPRPEGLLGDP